MCLVSIWLFVQCNGYFLWIWCNGTMCWRRQTFLQTRLHLHAECMNMRMHTPAPLPYVLKRSVCKYAIKKTVFFSCVEIFKFFHTWWHDFFMSISVFWLLLPAYDFIWSWHNLHLLYWVPHVSNTVIGNDWQNNLTLYIWIYCSDKVIITRLQDLTMYIFSKTQFAGQDVKTHATT